MKEDSDLESQLEGLFADADLRPELAPEEPDLPTERKIIDLLESEVEAQPGVAQPTAPEPPMIETDPFVLAQRQAVESEPEGQALDSGPAGFPTWEAQLQEQRVRTINIMLGSLAGIGAVIIIFLLINLFKEPSRMFWVYVPYFAGYAVLLALALTRRLTPRVRATMLVVLAYCVGVSTLLTEGPLSAGGLYLVAAPLLASMLIRQWAGAVAAMVSNLLYAGFLLADHQGLLHPTIPYDPAVLPSILSLSATFLLISASIMFIQWMFHQTLTGALRAARQQHGESMHSRALLEKRAEELSKANALLQKRTLQLQTAAQVSSATTLSVLDPDELAQQVVDLIQDQFNLYYVGLFLADDTDTEADDADTYASDTHSADDERWVRLQAGTGEAGRQMLALGYKIRVDTSSSVGWCMVNAQARITRDVGAIHLASSSEHIKAARLLPDTRSEMALPLGSRGRVIGVLVLRSTEQQAFSQEDIPVLQTMADQIALAIDNAQLYARAQQNLREVEEIQRRYVREQWADFVATHGVPTYERTQPDVLPLGDAVLPEVKQALARREMVLQSSAGNGSEQAALVVPIRLRNEAIGVLGLQGTEEGQRWTESEIGLIEAVADQMALAIENARLLEETQQRADRERIIASITARVRASMDPETILRTAVRELGAALGSDRAFVKLGPGKQADDKSQNPEA
jgi:GAF domain-containing protein